MASVEASTVVYLPPEEVYEFLIDVPRYARYSRYLERVRANGDGGPGTRYALAFAWWKLEYTVHVAVTAVDPPARIDWGVNRGGDASGYWRVEKAPDEAPDGEETASRVTLRVEYDPDSASTGQLNHPAFVPLSRVVERLRPVVEREAVRVVERVVADLEGRRRSVDLQIRTAPNA